MHIRMYFIGPGNIMPQFSSLAGATSVGAAIAPLGVWAQDRPPECPKDGKPYDAMVLSCIDYCPADYRPSALLYE